MICILWKTIWIPIFNLLFVCKKLELHCAIGELDLVMGRVSEIRVVAFVGYAKRFIFIFSQIFTMMSFQSLGCRTLKTHQIWIKIDRVKWRDKLCSNLISIRLHLGLTNFSVFRVPKKSDLWVSTRRITNLIPPFLTPMKLNPERVLHKIKEDFRVY